MTFRRKIGIAALAVAAICLAVAGTTFLRARRALQQAATAVNADENFAVHVQQLSLSGASRFDWLPAPAVFTGGAIFDGHVYLCGPAGLFEYASDGQLLREFRVGRELPASPLTALATGALSGARSPELLIATHGAGVLAWDGAHMRQIAVTPSSPASQASRGNEADTVTALLPLSSGRLLIGTAHLGLLVYDGQRLRYFDSALKNLYITALAGSESGLWIGTQSNGAYHWQGGSAVRIAQRQGLPDPHVNAIALDGLTAYIATPVGVAQVAGDRVRRVLGDGVFSQSVAISNRSLTIGSFGQGLMNIPLAAERRSIRPLVSSSSSAVAPSPPPIVQIFSSGNNLYAVSRDALYARSAAQGWRKVISAAPSMLTARNISALAVDGAGRLWIGYFDRGVDIVSPGLARASHIENDHIYCVNRIVPDSASRTVDVATANGLAVFDGDGRQRQVIGRSAGLIAEDVTDVVPYRGGMAVSTPAGITFFDSTGAHSLYAFQGLVNNHVYTIAMRGDRLIAGTLGGVSILDDGAVRLNLTTSTSALRRNWINAVASVGDGWLVGTYGAGVEYLDAQNNFHSTGATRSGVYINPNAMLVTPGHVLAGTLSDGLLVLNRQTGRWRTITAGLPSLNVTAFTRSGDTIYIGTDNGLVKLPEERLDQ